MTQHSVDVGDALADAARAMNSPRDLQQTLDAIVHAAVATLPDFDHVGISTIHRDGTVQTRAASDDVVWQFDALQYELGEGPCLDAIRDETRPSSFIVEYAAQEQRWPAFIPQAVKVGLKAQLGIQLYSDADSLGGLNLYSTTSQTIDDESHQMADLFATHAALAMGRARREDQLNEGMASRKLIGKAIGITMEHLGIDEERAFELLIRASSSSNTKLRLIAEEVVQLTNARAHGDHRLDRAPPRRNGRSH